MAPIDEPKVDGLGDGDNWLSVLVKRIRSVWMVIATIFAMLAFINTQIETAIKPENPLTKLYFWISDRIFDGPSLTRVSNAHVNSSIDGYVYFETDGNGGPTSDGRLISVAGELNFSDLSSGSLLKAIDGVNLRAEATSHSQLVFVLGEDECVLVAGAVKKVTDFGGWVPVKRSKCA